MASAIIGGLIKQGISNQTIHVIEPLAEARDKLQSNFGIAAQPLPGAALTDAALVVWAVKPQATSRLHNSNAHHPWCGGLPAW